MARCSQGSSRKSPPVSRRAGRGRTSSTLRGTLLPAMGQRGQCQTHATAALLPACTSPWGRDTEGQPGGSQQAPPSMPSYLCLKTFFSFLEQYPQISRKSQAAGAPRLVLRVLPARVPLLPCSPLSVSIHLWLASLATALGRGG